MITLAESNPPPAWFTFLVVVAMLLGFAFGRVIFRNPAYVIGAFFVGSALMYQLWAWIYGRTWVINPAHQYPSAWYGDLVVLPLLVAVPMVVLYNQVPHQGLPRFFMDWRWQVIAALMAVAVAYGFRRTQTAIFPPDVLNSPWKLWHDWFAFSFLSYLLLLGAPVFFSRWGLGQLASGKLIAAVAMLPIIGLATFVWLGSVADRHMDVRAPGGHVRVDIYGWNWARHERVGPYVIDDPRKPNWRWVLPAHE